MLIQVSNMSRYRVKKSEIERLRSEKRDDVITEIQGHQCEMKENLSHSITRTKFLNKFYLYCGVARSSDWKKEAESLNVDVLELLKCDKKWPVCLFDFTYKNKVPEFFVFRVAENNYHVTNNYFYGEMAEEKSVSSNGK